MILRSIDVLSCGKILGALYAILGLIAGGIFALISLAGLSIAHQADGANPALPMMFFGAGAVVILPIMYGVMGFIGGIVMAAIYNVVAGVVGGIELNLEPTVGRGGAHAEY